MLALAPMTQHVLILWQNLVQHNVVSLYNPLRHSIFPLQLYSLVQQLKIRETLITNFLIFWVHPSLIIIIRMRQARFSERCVKMCIIIISIAKPSRLLFFFYFRCLMVLLLRCVCVHKDRNRDFLNIIFSCSSFRF